MAGRLSCPRCNGRRKPEDRFCASCGAEFSVVASGAGDGLIGVTVGDKFLLRELIGSGGMGKVYRADHVGVGRTVAVKIMHRHLVGDQTAATRFTNEARAASTLNHPHSIAVIDFGQTDNGTLFMAMEHLQGRSLAEVIRHDFPFPFGRVAYLLCQAADAVAAAHDLAIIHRDLKPENIFLLDHPQGMDFIKVLDFGIAKLLDVEDRSVTTPGLVPGTPEYMSPEQARGEVLDGRTDVYSLGVILYELIAGQVPFREVSAIATMMAHVQEAPMPPSLLRKDQAVPAALESIVLWALAKERAERIASARQFRDVLSAWAKTALVWPVGDLSASSTDVLLEHFSQSEVSEFREQLDSVHHLARLSGPSWTSASGELARPSFPQAIVGRTAELDVLQQFLTQPSGGQLRLHGEVGVGKHRLCESLSAMAAAEGLTCLRSRPADGWMPLPLAPAHDIFLQLLGLPLEIPAAESLLAAANRYGLEREDVCALKDVFGFPGPLSDFGPETRRHERRALLRQMIAIAVARQPLLLILEDLDRCDAASQDLLTILATESFPGLFVVTTYVEEPLSFWPAHVTSLPVAPLAKDAAVAFLAHALPQPILRQIKLPTAHTGEGTATPLFLQQLAYAVLQEGMIHPPERIADLIAGRVERLDLQQRVLVQSLAVLGSASDSKTLERVAAMAIDLNVIDPLIARGFVARQGEAIGFVHPLLAQVVHAAIPAGARRDLHQRAANTYRQDGAFIGTIAHHAYEADEGEAAITALIDAGAWADRCLDFRSAIRHTSRALDLVRREWGRGRIAAEELDRVAVTGARRLAEALRQTGESQVAQGTLEEILSVASGTAADRAALRFDLSVINLSRGELHIAARHLRLALNELQHQVCSPAKTEIILTLAKVHTLMGETTEAETLISQIPQAAAATSGAATSTLRWNDHLLAAEVHQLLATSEARREHDQAPLLARQAAQAHLVAALREATAAGASSANVAVAEHAAKFYSKREEWVEAEVHLSHAITILRRIGCRSLLATFLVRLAQVRRMLGATDHARKLLDEAKILADAVGWAEGGEQIRREEHLLGVAS